MYYLSRTFDFYPQFQQATFNDLDFKLGWQNIENYENYYGNCHIILNKYENIEDVWTQTNQYILYELSTLYKSILIKSLNDNSIIFNGSQTYRSLIDATIYNYTNDGSTILAFSKLDLSRQSTVYWYNLNNSNLYGSNNGAHILIYNSTTGENPMIVDTFNVMSVENAFTINCPVAQIFITEQGKAYLFYYYDFRNKNVELGFGSQPFAYYENGYQNIIVLLRRFGIIFKITLTMSYSASTRYNYTVTSEEIFDYGDCAIKGIGTNYFLQINDEIIKKNE